MKGIVFIMAGLISAGSGTASASWVCVLQESAKQEQEQDKSTDSTADDQPANDPKKTPEEISQELAEIYENDQADRKNFQNLTTEQRMALPGRDQKRRARVAEIIENGQLKTPADYYHAAMVYQHGTQPADFLRSHLLATAAAIRGDERGRWLSAAALDRYLQAVKQPQVFGTQYRNDGKGWTQKPFDTKMIADALRADFNVPSVEKSAARLKEIEKMMQSKQNK